MELDLQVQGNGFLHFKWRKYHAKQAYNVAYWNYGLLFI